MASRRAKAAFAVTLDDGAEDRIAALGIPPVPERWIGFLLGGRDARLLIVAIGAVLGQPVAVLIVLIVTSTLSLVVRLVLVRTTLPGAWRPR